MAGMRGAIYGKMYGYIYPKFYPKFYPKLYGEMYGKFYGNRTTHLGGEILKIVRNRDGRYKFDIGFLSSFISESAVPSGNLDDLGSVGVPGLAGGLAGCRVS